MDIPGSSLGVRGLTPKESQLWHHIERHIEELEIVDQTRQFGQQFSPETESQNWVISNEQLEIYRKIFDVLDENRDGYITGPESVHFKLFIPSETIHIKDLAQIWHLSDVDKDRKLNFEEFAIAEYLMDVKSRGGDLPSVLPRSMVTGSMKKVRSTPDLTDMEHNAAAFPNSNSFPGISLLSQLSPSKIRQNFRSKSPVPDRDQHRPANLPPKSPSEVDRHNREIKKLEKIHENFLRKVARENEKKEQLRLSKEKRILEAKPIWEEIIAKWPQKKNLPKTRQLWWAGLPQNLRGKLWELGVPNGLGITPELFVILGEKALKISRKSPKKSSNTKLSEISSESSPIGNFSENSSNQLLAGNPTEVLAGNSSTENLAGNSPSPSKFHENFVTNSRVSSVDLIPLDLYRTFPLLGFFQRSGPMSDSLRKILEAWVCLRPDIGYVQGMSFMGAVLLLNMEVFPAFSCLANLLSRELHLTFFNLDNKEMEKYINLFENQMSKELPKIYRNLKTLGIFPQMYLIEWVMTIFSKSLPLDVAVRLWDVYIYEGESFIFRAALGLLKYFSSILETGAFDEIVYLLTHLPKVDEEEFFGCIEKINFTEQMYKEILSL